MNSIRSNVYGRDPLRRSLPGWSLGIALSLLTFSPRAADDPYLELLDAEAAKVETVPTDTAEDGDTPSRRRSVSGDAGPASSRDAFEAQMRARHVGTYSFYRRLPERSREAIFLDYVNGASLEALRSKIIDRYLHP